MTHIVLLPSFVAYYCSAHMRNACDVFCVPYINNKVSRGSNFLAYIVTYRHICSQVTALKLVKLVENVAPLRCNKADIIAYDSICSVVKFHLGYHFSI